MTTISPTYNDNPSTHLLPLRETVSQWGGEGGDEKVIFGVIRIFKIQILYTLFGIYEI